MILLLGANSYVGQAFGRQLRARGQSYIPLTLDALEYTDFHVLFDYVRRIHPEFLINAVDEEASSEILLSQKERLEAIRVNAVLPQTVARACLMTNTPWGHVSSGSIYCGAKVLENGKFRVERDNSGTRLAHLLKHDGAGVVGFTEQDEPNFSFRSSGRCGFGSGTKALAEEALRGQERAYIWRARLAFNEWDDPANWLSQLQRRTVLDRGVNSVSHLEDFVMACLELWERRAPFGIYNVVNPGLVVTSDVLQMIQRILRPALRFHCLTDVEESAEPAGKDAPPSCLLDSTKLRRAGVKLRGAEEALEDALQRWKVAADGPVNGHRLQERAELRV
jgi:dTDP-4-dehydrorhamnose reductase